MTDFLDEKRREIQARLKELKPLVDEYQRLEAAERALAGVSNGARPRAAPPPAHVPRAPGRRAGTGRRGRPKGSGQRAAAGARAVRSRPGITVPELAEAMGIKQNYLYRVMPGLAAESWSRSPGAAGHLREAPA